MTNSTPSHWRLDVDSAAIGWLCLDRHDATTNTLSADVMRELDQQLRALADRQLKGLVLFSGKSNGFVAGADINEFPKLTSAAVSYELTRNGQQVLGRLAALPLPTVAVLNGFALGGGLELALACRQRLAFDGHEPVFGLPEVQLGLHPGFGGTVRTPRIVGVRQAMDLMLTGRSWTPRQALRAGLVDELVTAESWRSRAADRIQHPPAVRHPPLLDRILALPMIRGRVARFLARTARRKASPEHYPAPFAMIDLWARYGAAEAPESYDAEARSFADLVVTPTSRNLVRVFFLQDRLKKLGSDGAKAQRVHVIGAGVMGGDIAAWCVLRGLSVTLQDREMKFIEPALSRATALFDRKIRDPKAAAAARQRLVADVEGRGAADADVIIEAVFEDIEVKRSVYARLEPQMKPGALLATNTSSIPLERLADCLTSPGRLVGLHFFNPVAKLPLVEVIGTAHTEPAALAQCLAFAKQIGKLPVPCRSHPGFLVNRILAPYMGEALELLREGVPMAEIDQAAIQFGMPMGPVELADSVGLDVAMHVARTLAPIIRRPPAPELDELVRKGQLGVKTGRGFYTYRDGRPVRPTLDRGTPDPEVQDRLILAMVNEAAQCLHESIVSDPDLIDAGVIFGTGFAPFRGGPLQYARSVGVANITARLHELAAKHGDRFLPSPGWQRVGA